MCVPVAVAAAIATGVTAVASTAANIVASNKQAKAARRSINEQALVANEEARDEATAQLFDQMRSARREQGRTMAAAGEAGLSLQSGSVEALLMDSAMQTEFKNDRTLANMESRHNAAMAEAESMMSRYGTKTTALGAGLQLAATGAQAWAGIEAAKIKTT